VYTPSTLVALMMTSAWIWIARRAAAVSVEKMLVARKAKIHDYAVLFVGEGIEKPSTSVH